MLTLEQVNQLLYAATFCNIKHIKTNGDVFTVFLANDKTITFDISIQNPFVWSVLVDCFTTDPHILFC